MMKFLKTKKASSLFTALACMWLCIIVVSVALYAATGAQAQSFAGCIIYDCAAFIVFGVLAVVSWRECVLEESRKMMRKRAQPTPVSGQGGM